MSNLGPLAAWPLHPEDDRGTPKGSSRIKYILNVVRQFVDLWDGEPPFFRDTHRLGRDFSSGRRNEKEVYAELLDGLQRANEDHGLNAGQVQELRSMIEARSRHQPRGLLSSALESPELGECPAGLESSTDVWIYQRRTTPMLLSKSTKLPALPRAPKRSLPPHASNL